MSRRSTDGVSTNSQLFAVTGVPDTALIINYDAITGGERPGIPCVGTVACCRGQTFARMIAPPAPEELEGFARKIRAGRQREGRVADYSDSRVCPVVPGESLLCCCEAAVNQRSCERG